MLEQFAKSTINCLKNTPVQKQFSILYLVLIRKNAKAWVYIPFLCCSTWPWKKFIKLWKRWKFGPKSSWKIEIVHLQLYLGWTKQVYLSVHYSWLIFECVFQNWNTVANKCSCTFTGSWSEIHSGNVLIGSLQALILIRSVMRTYLRKNIDFPLGYIQHVQCCHIFWITPLEQTKVHH